MGIAATILPLVLQYGIPAALQIAALWKSQDTANAVAIQEWIDLLTLINRTADQAISDAEKRAGPVVP